MKNTCPFRPYDRDQLLLLPLDLSEWLDKGDLAYFILDVVRELGLSAVLRPYRSDKGGQPPYHPEMMVALVLYAYCVGIASSRKIEQATYHSVPFRVLTANQHPDHDTIAAFRKKHLKALADLFVQVLRLCQKAGLAKLGHVALDGTKVAANASKHKAMSYGRMEKTEAELAAKVEALLKQAEATDAAEDALYGQGQREEDLPKELRFQQKRLDTIREAKRALEEEAKAKAEAARPEYEKKMQAYEARNGRGGKPQPPSEVPAPKAQRNFTDPESRIMKDGATKAFVQAYNCQAAVDGGAQVVVAATVTQQANDKQQVEPMIEAIKANLDGHTPAEMSMDSGYFSAKNVTTLENEKIDAYIAVDRQKHGTQSAPVEEENAARLAPAGTPAAHSAAPTPCACERQDPQAEADAKSRMSDKLRTTKGRATYSQRKQIVEPVFGQIKEAQRFRRFSFRGLVNVTHEWSLVCLTHTLLKIFRSDWRPETV
jgi:transposase